MKNENLDSRINESRLIKCGLEIIPYENQTHTLEIMRKALPKRRILGILLEGFYMLECEYYDSELGGVIDVNLKVHKVKLEFGRYGWIAVLNYNHFFEIKKMDDIVDISSTIYFNSEIGFCYIIRSEYGYKIGMSKSIHSRSKTFNVKLPFQWEFREVYALERYKDMEKMLHELFESKHINGEWFDLSEKDIQLSDQLYYKLL